MTTLEIALTDELEKFVREQVAIGAYTDAASVVQDALLRLAYDTAFPEGERIASIRAALQPGLDDIEAGRIVDLSVDDIMREAKALK